MPAPIAILALGSAALLLLASSSKKSAATGGTGGTKAPGGTGGGPPLGSYGTVCPPAGSPDYGVEAMPEPYKTAVNTALMTSTDPNALDVLAMTLTSCGQIKAATQVAARAKALRDAGIGGPSKPPVLSTGGDTQAGATKPAGTLYASSAAVPWTHLVTAGQGPIVITKVYFGGTGDARRASDNMLRWIELIEANPDKATVGNKAAPFSSDNPDGKPFNFASLVAGEHLKIPADWSPWISEEGYPRGSITPYPSRAIV